MHQQFQSASKPIRAISCNPSARVTNFVVILPCRVQIDVEGLDDIVLQMLPLGRLRQGVIFRPASIVFEQCERCQPYSQ